MSENQKNEEIFVYFVKFGKKFKKKIKCINFEIFTEDVLAQSDIPINLFNCYYITFFNFFEEKWDLLIKTKFRLFKTQLIKEISVKINFQQLLLSYAQYKIDEYQEKIEQSMINPILVSDENEINNLSTNYSIQGINNQPKKENVDIKCFIVLDKTQFSVTEISFCNWILTYKSNNKFSIKSFDKKEKKNFNLCYKKKDENSFKLTIRKESLERLEKGEYIQNYIISSKDNINNGIIESAPFSVKVIIT